MNVCFEFLQEWFMVWEAYLELDFFKLLPGVWKSGETLFSEFGVLIQKYSNNLTKKGSAAS